MIVPVVSKNSDLLKSLDTVATRFATVDSFVQATHDSYVGLIGAHGLLVVDTCSIDREVCTQLVESFHVDDWSTHQVIVLITDAHNRAYAQEIATKYSSVIAVLPSNNTEEYLCGVLYLFELNRNLLIKMRLQAQYSNETYVRFVLYNNPYAVPTFARALAGLLHYYGFVQSDEVKNVQLVLSELCVNAIEHGNCMISYEEKKQWLETHTDSVELIIEKNKVPEIAARFTTCILSINASSIGFEIIDQGDGFNWKGFVNGDSQLVKHFDAHGYGINLALAHAKHLTYNKKGNVASFSVPVTQQPTLADNSVLFSGSSHATYKQGERIVAYNPQLKGGNAHISLFENKKNKLFIFVDGMSIATIGNKTFHQDSNDIFCGPISLMLCQIVRQPLNIEAASTVRLAVLPPSEVRAVLNSGAVVQSLNQSLVRIIALL